METHSNWLKVSLIVGLLIASAVGFALWLIQSRDAEGPTYEIRFERSVGGLAKGASVNQLGVPVGTVTEVKIRPSEPDVVSVRFVLTRKAILRRGVTASIDRSLIDGSAKVSLEGGTNHDPAITAGPGQPFPVVPAKSGGLMGNSDGPADLIATVTSNAESISEKLDPAGLRAIEKRLDEFARRSQAWKGDIGQAAGQIARADTISSVGDQAVRAGRSAAGFRQRLEASRGGLRQSLAGRLKDAQSAAASLEQSITRVRPRIRSFAADAGQVTEKVRSVREPVRRVGDAARRIEQEGFGSPSLPDYRPSTEVQR